ncbi:class I SAM-dependent methyltransferase [Novosphingobium sp.]|uniref:class I SAM-dependent methyltransferase n=1 Tax=Novosphingobium sp. TaxID=1874826 RepID=UPI001EC872A3|nr:class I SAM-dependent methyltransferase [Novosphingobium sp.]MBK6802286.1 class I SAM-dependent methyltransferase [Novosphingobium sp.]MBK9009658.1 class I SAM-dependent methyltransferase [Novosphingobium sp.]
MRFRQIRDGAIQKANELLRYLLVDVIGSKAFIDVYLYRYSSYEEYRQVQIYHNLRKLKRVWADPQTLDLLADELVARLGSGPLRGLCHGTRNGFEQNHLNAQHPGWKVTGTDISPSAADFPNSVVWDFHDERAEWLGAFDFVYSNSLDQSWQPRVALETWLGQVRPGGVVVIEHSDEQSPLAAGEMDPFGVRPQVVPYVLAEWFGHRVSVSFRESYKTNIGRKTWLFFIMKTSTPA